jgi:hypothetical protein
MPVFKIATATSKQSKRNKTRKKQKKNARELACLAEAKRLVYRPAILQVLRDGIFLHQKPKTDSKKFEWFGFFLEQKPVKSYNLL